jgi:hypothetical protein
MVNFMSTDQCQYNIQTGRRVMPELRVNRNSVAWFTAGLMLVASLMSTTVVAETDSEKWKFDAEIYLWGADIGGTAATGDDIDVAFDDIFDILDMAFMGVLGASKGKWSLFLDAIYFDVSASDSFTESVPVIGTIELDVDVDADVAMKSWITTLGAGYNVVDSERATVNLVGGARYLWIETELKLDLSTVVMGEKFKRKEKESLSGSVWDGIVGVRGKINLSDKWFLPYYADIGTGQSDLTWQALLGIGYKFKHADVLLAYRYLDYEFDSDYELDDLNVSGPGLGVKFYF